MQGFRFGPGRKLGHGVYLPEEAADDFTGILALTQAFNLRHRARERVFGLGDGHVRVVLALLLETLVMLEKFLAKELRETLTTRAGEWPSPHNGINACQAIFRGHYFDRS